MTSATEASGVDQIRSFLDMQVRFMESREFRRQEGGYLSVMEFVHRHGKVFEPAPWDGRFKKGRMKQCFSNAFILAVESGLRYVEGYAVSPHFPMPISHAWNVDEQGRAVDITWENKGLAYLGIEFATGRVDDAIMHGTGCVLDDWERGFPLLQQPWTGEDFERVWPETEQVPCIRKFPSIFMKNRKKASL
jgi:hypothetical protein